MSNIKLERNISSEEPLKLTIVVPVYNEEDTVDIFLDTVNGLLSNRDDIDIDYVFVNDGSSDLTLKKLLERQKLDNRISIIGPNQKLWKRSCYDSRIA